MNETLDLERETSNQELENLVNLTTGFLPEVNFESAEGFFIDSFSFDGTPVTVLMGGCHCSLSSNRPF